MATLVPRALADLPAGPRRPDDRDRIVATGKLATRDLDWKARYTVDEMLPTAWRARTAAESVHRSTGDVPR